MCLSPCNKTEQFFAIAQTVQSTPAKIYSEEEAYDSNNCSRIYIFKHITVSTNEVRKHFITSVISRYQSKHPLRRTPQQLCLKSDLREYLFTSGGPARGLMPPELL